MKLIFAFIFALFSFAIIGCQEKGPAEKAGAKADKSYQSIKDKVQNKGKAQKAGEKIDKALE